MPSPHASQPALIHRPRPIRLHSFTSTSPTLTVGFRPCASIPFSRPIRLHPLISRPSPRCLSLTTLTDLDFSTSIFRLPDLHLDPALPTGAGSIRSPRCLDLNPAMAPSTAAHPIDLNRFTSIPSPQPTDLASSVHLAISTSMDSPPRLHLMHVIDLHGYASISSSPCLHLESFASPHSPHWPQPMSPGFLSVSRPPPMRLIPSPLSCSPALLTSMPAPHFCYPNPFAPLTSPRFRRWLHRVASTPSPHAYRLH